MVDDVDLLRAPRGKRRQARGLRCVRTSITLAPRVMAALDRMAIESGKSRSAVIAKALDGRLPLIPDLSTGCLPVPS